MSETLKLQLFKKYQKATERGMLKQEVRPINAKWMSELLLYNGKHLERRQWHYLISKKGLKISDRAITFKSFDLNEMYLQRNKIENETRVILEHKGIEIKGRVFIIFHGNIVQHSKPVESKIADGFVEVVKSFLARNPKITPIKIAGHIGYSGYGKLNDIFVNGKNHSLTDPIKDKIIDFMKSVEADIEVKIVDNKSE